ncbi:hypothetical protein IK146_02255 [Candidatus Saccharibacteria bacterium]|nr:hypothetical protein [Candidatus Saccharibacteria bacterium]
MNVNLNDSGSIILGLGDLKVSDTYDVFGKRAEVNGILYQPLVNPGSSMSQPIGVHLALGDAMEGVLIKQRDNEIYFTYGANRPTSHAQSMAIGFHDKEGFFFIVEYFTMAEIYTSSKPKVCRRTIVRCASLCERRADTTITTTFNKDSDCKFEIGKADKVSIKELMSRVQAVSKAFSKGCLDGLWAGRKSA